MARTPQSQSPDSEAAVAEAKIAESEKTAVPASEKVARKKPQRRIYIGPNIPGGTLIRYQVFKGDLPPHCEDLFQKIPEVKELFVDVAALAAAERRVETPGTKENGLFLVVLKKTEKGGV